MPEVQAFRNHIIFQFEREIVRKKDNGYERTQFQDETDWGFQVSNYDEGANDPQWAIITSVGPEVREVKVGDRVLIVLAKSYLQIHKLEPWNTEKTTCDRAISLEDFELSKRSIHYSNCILIMFLFCLKFQAS